MISGKDRLGLRYSIPRILWLVKNILAIDAARYQMIKATFYLKPWLSRHIARECNSVGWAEQENRNIVGMTPMFRFVNGSAL